MTPSPRQPSIARTFFKSLFISLVLFLELGVIGWYILTQTTLVFPIRSPIVDSVATTLFGGAEALDTYAHPDDPDNVEGSIICNDVSRDDSLILLHAFSRMRRTSDGSRLYQQMVDNGICVTVRDLDFHVGLAHPWDSFVSGWGHSYIEIDADHLRESTLDIVATTLVHESTHIDRAIQGTDCSYNGGCTVIENGVRLEEEIAAHGAEAQWWIDVYGYTGKPGPTSEEAWENQLALAYMTGDEYFADYVREMRSDPRESKDRT
jgi:pentatricopeptide repeat protein